MLIENFRFATAPVLLALIPALLIAWRWSSGKLRNAPPVLQYSDTTLVSGLPASTRVRLRRIPDALRFLAWIILIIALARPQSGTNEEILRGEGIDIVITLDISDSMSDPLNEETRRINAAKQIVADFISGRVFDQIGIVIFGSNAFYYAPPTLDYNTLNQMIENLPLASQLGLGSNTAIGDAIASSINMLPTGDQATDSASQVIILLTDGNDRGSTISPITAAEIAATYDIRIYTVGISVNDTGADTLRAIAGATGGRFYNATTFDQLQSIYQEIDDLEGNDIERQIKINWVDRANILIIAALILLLIERILRQTIFQTIP